MPKQPAHQQTTMFYGEDIIALQHLDPNETYIVIAQLCDQLGLNRAAQEKRVRSHAVLASGARKLQIERENGTETALCLRADLLPLWLLGVDASSVTDEARARLELFQRESASMLWQSFKPQGFSSEDDLLPDRHEQTPAEQAYV
ncbi:MAG TPA: phage antirepressor N-terminal domain-containing protein, partial [Roseiflexaceae bacterium]|nr:phage antirepressor N-terminal domain-containing protein [Roseiflexaceae bacterium]